MAKTLPNEVSFVQQRPAVEVHLPDDRVLSGPRGATIGEFLNSLPEAGDPPIVGAIVNHELRELTYPIMMEDAARCLQTIGPGIIQLREGHGGRGWRHRPSKGDYQPLFG